ncbi:hypothetical protein H1230_10150 [Paenibacillus sp. 19GGS1-52]|uniref:hypothetical protein n=1 Tax=Paenibacillus sp. 19GGS1-52 TaxID=2758563 RepID=UPI001EFB37A8|nr:hypothetical protein [Paenibacillus sp. 19GGS1-52]ULO09091.1 hypothetical protein H1230_10150 [Paenibacillus sp. 19GGS1-52]
MVAKLNEVPWTREQLWNGCMLAAIAHAIMVSHFPKFSNEHSWDGFNYSVQDSAGTRGTVTFHPELCVAAFRNEKSGRISVVDNKTDNYFQGASERVNEVAQAETLQYLLDEINNLITPVITTAIWEDNNKIVTADTLEDMMDNGGFILERQGMDMDSAIKAWVDYYEMSEAQIALMKSIFEKKIVNPTTDLYLSKEEIGMIGSDDPEGLGESKISFEEINILWEG